MKTRLLFLSFAALIFSCLSVFSAKAAVPEVLIEAIENSMSADVTITDDVSITYGKSMLTAESVIKQDGLKMQNTSDMHLEIYLQDLDSYMPEGEIKADLDLDYMKDIEKKQHFLTLNKALAHVELGDPLMEEFINGFMEYVKVFSGKTYELNVQEIQDRLMQIVEEYKDHLGSDVEEFQMMINNIGSELELRENLGDFLREMLDSGLMKVTKSGEQTYKISFADRPRLINAKEFLQAILDFAILPPDAVEEIQWEIENMTQDDIVEIREESEEAFAMLKKAMTFSLVIELQNRKVKNVETEFTFYPNEVPEFDLELPHSLKISGTSKFVYSDVSLSLPRVTEEMVSVTKFFKGIIAMMEYTEKQMAEYRESWGDDDFYYNQPIDVTDIREEMRNNPSYEWYEEYTYHVDNTLYTDLGSYPSEYITNEDFYILLVSLLNYYDPFAIEYEDLWGYFEMCGIESDDIFYYNNLIDIQKRIGQFSKDRCVNVPKDLVVQRGKGLETIMMTIFPDADNPLVLAENLGFVSSTYVEGKNRYQPMNKAEMAKIISKVLDHYHYNR